MSRSAQENGAGDPRDELSRRLAAQIDGLLDGEDADLAECFVESLAPGDAQEETLAMQMALTHQVAMAQLVKAGQEDLPERPQQITLGIAARFLTLHHRQSAALDRHRGAKVLVAERAARAEAREATRAAAAKEEEAQAGFLVIPVTLPMNVWAHRARKHHQRAAAGLPIPEEEHAAYEARCEAAIAAAVARGQTSGSVDVPYEPEPGDPGYPERQDDPAIQEASLASLAEDAAPEGREGMPPWAQVGPGGAGGEPPPRPPP